MTQRSLIAICVLMGGIVFGYVKWRDASSRQQLSPGPVVTIDKQPVTFASRSFDPAAPSADMPQLGPGEDAECDSKFQSNASVGGATQQTDSTHATLTITHVKIMLQLNITTWVPTGVTQHVIEHEEGHRQISEYYYQTADKLAEQIADTYVGRQMEITGTDLNAESGKMLQQVATEITDEYANRLNPGPTQLLYDSITDHSRNEMVAKDAVAAAVRNMKTAPSQATTNSGNWPRKLRTLCSTAKECEDI